jgi:hypothetical protein
VKDDDIVEGHEATEFKPGPFNYCDYRCDRCDEQAKCRVFKEEQERLLEHYAKGEDSNDPEVFLQDMHKIFEKTKEMLEKTAAEQGINLGELPLEEAKQVEPETYVVYNCAHDYFEQAHLFIKKLEKEGSPASVEDDVEDLVWYHTLIAAKTGRLVSGFEDEIDEVQKIDEEGTLKVINKGIGLSKKALEHMLNELPGHLQDVATLLSLLKRIEKQIATDIRGRQQNGR